MSKVVSGSIDLSEDITNNILSLPSFVDSVVKSNRGGWQSELFDVNSFEWMRPTIHHLLQAAGCTEITFWFNINGADHYNDWHDHDRGTGGELCGCLYITAPPNSGRFLYKQDGVENAIEPKPGQYILFPDNLQHCVELNNSGEKRISIAFNFWRMLPKYR